MTRLASRARQTDMRDRHDDRGDSAGRGDVGALDEDVARVGVIGEPPPEEGRRLVDGPPEELEPGMAELRLEAQPPCRPLRRCPDRKRARRRRRGALGPRGFWSRTWRRKIRRASEAASKSELTRGAATDTVACKLEGAARFSGHGRRSNYRPFAADFGDPPSAGFVIAGHRRVGSNRGCETTDS